MRPIERGELLGLAEYETIRPRFRTRVIEEKKLRRVAVGPSATCVFENRDTVLLQIQEMLRTERITREGAIVHEMETYNEQIPAPNELSCTMMVAEIADKEARDHALVRAKGIEKCIALVVGDVRYPAAIDPKFLLDDQASAVMFLKFPLGADGARAIREASQSGGKVALVIDHATYSGRGELSPEVLANVVQDLD